MLITVGGAEWPSMVWGGPARARCAVNHNPLTLVVVVFVVDDDVIVVVVDEPEPTTTL